MRLRKKNGDYAVFHSPVALPLLMIASCYKRLQFPAHTIYRNHPLVLSGKTWRSA